MPNLESFIFSITREIFAVRQEVERVNQLTNYVGVRLGIIQANFDYLSITPELFCAPPESLQFGMENKNLVRLLDILMPMIEKEIERIVGYAGGKFHEIRISIIDARFRYPDVATSEEFQVAIESLINELDFFFTKAVSASGKQSQIFSALKMKYL